jgi:glycosyltransferase involved in cell wall biosynthesis
MSKKITIAMVSPYPEVDEVIRGGVESVSCFLINTLKKNDSFNVFVIAPGGKMGAVENRDGVSIHWLGSGKLPGFLEYWTLERQRIHRILRNINPDITHFQGVMGWSINYHQLYVTTTHGIAEKDALFSSQPFPKFRSWVIAKVEGYARRKSLYNIIINPYVLDVVGNQLTGENRKIENPVAGELFNTERNVTGKRLLYIGRLSSRKNVKGLIKVFSLVVAASPDSELRMCGMADSPAFLDECKLLVSKLGLTGKVNFLGSVDRQNILDELSRATILTLLSHQELAPIVIEEAMAVGVPVVVSNKCGMPYMVEHGITGFLVEREDHKKTAEHMVALLNDHKLNDRMSKASKKMARERFHVSHVAKLTDEYYMEIIHNFNG